MLNSYACRPEKSRGRMYHEDPTPYRNEFERDRDRIIHSNAFKRLQYKTQVFVNHEGDHYRNRLTHSIEVSAIARSVSKALGLCDDLSEAVALAHDLGHTPFGHAGEDALDLCMKDFGGFSHNAHSFKILTELEHKYVAYNGLNLSWEVLDGVAKHNGPLIDSNNITALYHYRSRTPLANSDNPDINQAKKAGSECVSLADQSVRTRIDDSTDKIAENKSNLNPILDFRGLAEELGVSPSILSYDDRFPLELEKCTSAEAQVASLADDIAYIGHDFEDSIRAQLISYKSLEELEFISKIMYKIKKEAKGIEDSRLVYEVVRKLIHNLVEDLLSQTKRNIYDLKIKTQQDIRDLNQNIVSFSPEINKEIKSIKSFFRNNVYSHERVAELTYKSKIVVRKLFKLYKDRTELLPEKWQKMLAGDDEFSHYFLKDGSNANREYLKMSLIADYIAGMTDRFAIKEYQSYYNLNFSNTGL